MRSAAGRSALKWNGVMAHSERSPSETASAAHHRLRRPTPDWKAFWSAQSSGIHRFETEDFLQREAREKLLHMPAGGRLLDFGCGSADLLVYYADAFTSIVGADYSPSMLAKARERLQRFGIRTIELVEADDRSVWDLGLGTFDCITADGVVQYLNRRQLERFVQRAAGALAPGGAICLFGVLDPLQLLLWEGGWFRTNVRLLERIVGVGRAAMVQAARRMLGRQRGFGIAYSPDCFVDIAGQSNLRIEFARSVYYEYRYHVLLRKA